MPVVNSALVSLASTKSARRARPAKYRRPYDTGQNGEARFPPADATPRSTLSIYPPTVAEKHSRAGGPGNPSLLRGSFPRHLAQLRRKQNGGERRQLRASNPAGPLFKRPRRPRNSFAPLRPALLSRKPCAEEQTGNAEYISPSNCAPPSLNRHHEGGSAPKRPEGYRANSRMAAF